MRQIIILGLIATSIAASAAAVLVAGQASQSNSRAAIDSDDIGGVVTSTKGPEAGVWVIAETTELKTKFARIVVTDDRGRYVLPDLPTATYNVWVRGYGLLDSSPVTATPGKALDLQAVVAPNARAAAEVYPSNYWFALLQVPAPEEFPGTGPEGNGIAPSMKSQEQWINNLKTGIVGCEACHQLGNKPTREIPKSLGTFASSVDVWAQRVSSGQDGTQMLSILSQFGRERALKQFADWTDRIAAGEYPREAPPRPQGVERNVVISLWDWASPLHYIHDAVSTDKRHPAVNANGPLYGPNEVSSDNITALNPTTFEMTELAIPLGDSNMRVVANKVEAPWVHFGNDVIWNSHTSPHTSVIDEKGRVWTASMSRGPDTPEFCREGSTHPSAKLLPVNRSGRQASVYDPKTKKFTLIDTCFTTQHLQFAEDANNTLWFSSGMGAQDVVGWLNTKTFDETHDAQKALGWTALVLDTNGNGKRDDYVEPDQPVDPTKDKRIRASFYSVVASPVDGSVWGSYVTFPGAILRLSLGSNPPATTLTEIYEVPWNNPKAKVQGFQPRGIDIDRNGVVWTNLSGSGHFASFDRRKCKVVNGPTATGQHCPEGWTLYPMPGPSFKGVAPEGGGNADGSYFNFVDQFNTLGLGANLPMLSGNGSDSILVLQPDTGRWVTLRVPYPLGFYSKGFDGRIDDPNGGWKGRGLWSSYDERTPWHIEGGKGTYPKIVKFQMRPDPLAH